MPSTLIYWIISLFTAKVKGTKKKPAVEHEEQQQSTLSQQNNDWFKWHYNTFCQICQHRCSAHRVKQGTVKQIKLKRRAGIHACREIVIFPQGFTARMYPCPTTPFRLALFIRSTPPPKVEATTDTDFANNGTGNTLCISGFINAGARTKKEKGNAG